MVFLKSSCSSDELCLTYWLSLCVLPIFMSNTLLLWDFNPSGASLAFMMLKLPPVLGMYWHLLGGLWLLSLLQSCLCNDCSKAAHDNAFWNSWFVIMTVGYTTLTCSHSQGLHPETALQRCCTLHSTLALCKKASVFCSSHLHWHKQNCCCLLTSI